MLGSIISVCLLFILEYMLCMNYFNPVDKILLSKNLFVEAIDTLPGGFYVAIILLNVWVIFIGGMIPVALGSEHISHSLLVGIIVMAFGILNSMVIPFPLWYKLIGIFLCLPAAYAGGLIIKNSFSILRL